MALELQDVLDVLRDFADGASDSVDWEIINNLVEEHLNEYDRGASFENEQYLEDWQPEAANRYGGHWQDDDYKADDDRY